MTPSHPYSNLPHALSTANEIFSPLTSPALQPHRTSIDYLSFSGQNFALPTQFHQAQQQQLQHQLHQLQSQPQPELVQNQQQQQQQIQTSQVFSSNQTRIDAKSPALNSQRPSIKRKTTVERASNAMNPTTPRTAGPVRGSLTKSSPALRPLTNPMSPATLRKQQASRGRSSSIAPSSPLIMHFPTSRPNPSPLLISTSQPMSQASQVSPSPRLVTNMHHLSMMPMSPMCPISAPNGSKSPAIFALPASSMMPPPSSPMILPSASQMNNTPRQRSLIQQHQPIQVQSQHQLSIHQPISPGQASPALQPKAEGNGTSPAFTPSTSDKIDAAFGITNSATASASSEGTLKSALAPVTPASLMNLGAGSGTESTPTSPKFGVHAKSKPPTDAASTVSTSSKSSSASQKRGTKRQANGDSSPASGTLAPGTPRQLAMTPGTPSQYMPPPPPNGFALISPALKPTMMPQHRNSISMLVSPRLQPQLVSPSLKPWLPGVSTTEAMARLANKSNYQNILDGDHTALGLSYNTDLHSGIELRRTSHKAAEQKRRDSLKHCFDDLRHMIPNIQEKSPSKVFLLKKSFDFICNLKSEVAKRDLELARLKVQHEFMTNAMQAWMATLPDDSPFKQSTFGNAGDGEKGLLESWTIAEGEIKKATTKEEDAAARAAEMAEMSAAAVEAARTQPGGQNKGGKESLADGEDSDDEGPVTPKSNSKKSGSKTGSSSKRNGGGKRSNKSGTASAPAGSSALLNGSQKNQTAEGSGTLSNRSSDDDDDDDNDDDEAEDQEMTDATAVNT
ncbi:hypothetical protein EDD21DRAFT_112567 [Dissophora ornata]|nr:hypothetical protein EDD21DRAFT_112567 [Dissophora ornata]